MGDRGPLSVPPPLRLWTNKKQILVLLLVPQIFKSNQKPESTCYNKKNLYCCSTHQILRKSGPSEYIFSKYQKFHTELNEYVYLPYYITYLSKDIFLPSISSYESTMQFQSFENFSFQIYLAGFSGNGIQKLQGPGIIGKFCFPHFRNFNKFYFSFDISFYQS